MKKQTRIVFANIFLGGIIATIIVIVNIAFAMDSATQKPEVNVTLESVASTMTPKKTAQPKVTKKKKKKKTAYQKFKKIKACPWSKKKQWMVYKICRRYDISFEMCIAQAYQESRFHIKAIGDKGLACGGWQIHPSTWDNELARWGYSRQSMFDLKKACIAYCRIMRSHFKKYDDVEFALMAWRWGGYDGMVKLNRYGPDVYARQIIKRTGKYEKR